MELCPPAARQEEQRPQACRPVCCQASRQSGQAGEDAAREQATEGRFAKRAAPKKLYLFFAVQPRELVLVIV